MTHRHFVSLILCIVFFSSSLWAEDSGLDGRYAHIRAEYRELTIKDPFVSDLELWRELRAKLIELSNQSQGNIIQASVLYLKGRVAEQLGKKLPDRFLVKEAEQDFIRVYRNFPDSELADDALLGLSRISEYGKNEADKIKYAQLVIDTYPDTDSAEHAKRLLAQATPPVDPISNEKTEVGDLQSKYPVIAIDPGHGGVEEGAKGPDGVFEKDIVLKISYLLKDLLQKDTSLRVIMTRSGDETVSLAERTRIANEANAQLFLSIHANASEYKTGRGVETYYLDNTDDKSSLKLAERENFTSVGEADSVAFIVSDFIQGAKLDDSISLAHLVHDNLYKTLSSSFDSVKNLRVKKAPFFVLVGAHMPCVLVEVSFIDHPIEGRRLSDPRYQNMIAEGIFSGIRKYLAKKDKLKN